MPMLRLGLTLLILPLLLTGCATSVPAQVEKPNKTHLLQETPSPEYHGSTNGELVEHIAEWHKALESCNADKRAARGSDGLPVNPDAVR